MKRELKYAWSCLGSKTGLKELYLRFRHLQSNFQSVIILMYHRVVNPEECNDIFSTPKIIVTKDTFEKQIKFLSRHYRILSLEEFHGYHSSRKPLPPKSAVITFDDGWKDNYVNAFPILKKYGVPATIFLSTGFIETGDVFWQEKLRFLLTEFLKLPLNERDAFIKNFNNIPDNLKDCMAHGNKSVIMDTPETLMDMDEEGLNTFINDLEEFLRFPEFPMKDNGFMTWENAREMMNAKIDFGSHTVSHKIMTQISSKEILEELSISKSKIEKELNMQVMAFAYPNGNYNNMIMEKVKKTGYHYAVSVDEGLNSVNTDPFCMKRLHIDELRFLKPGGGFSEDIFSARLTNWL
ncbi:MAG: polysaccharide deacetylase family protein [Desulfobacteraceae bacterium]